jgi:predicted homoserine dehydrogenase-like protein
MIGINVDLANRESAGKPLRVGLLGAGQMGTDTIATTNVMKGVRIVAAIDIDLERARRGFEIGLIQDKIVQVNSSEEGDQVVREGFRVIASDYRILANMSTVEVMLDATGVPEIGAKASLLAARNGQHLATMNVEADITVGPIISWYAEKKGVLYALAAGDEPAACKELYDFADAVGFTVVAAGKGKNNPLDRYASPDDPQIREEAARRGLNPCMLVEFIDGSKTMIEMAAVSNSTGLVPDVRGMHGPLTDRDKLAEVFRLKQDGGILHKSGVVDYGIGRVAPGVFLIVKTDHPRLREAMVLRDMGDGPYYSLFRPYHLCSIEVPLTCALQVIRGQSNMRPLKKLVSEVFAVAKRDLREGDVLDGIGGNSFYSLIDTYENACSEGLLPIGLAKNALIVRGVRKGEPITYNHVKLHQPSTVLQLRRLQDAWMAGTIDETVLLIKVDALASGQ